MIQVRTLTVDRSNWAEELTAACHAGGPRYGHMTMRRDQDGRRRLEALILEPARGAARILSTWIPDGETEFPSVTDRLPAAHWGERAIGDYWGLKAFGHPRWKSLILHDAWPSGFHPFWQPSDGPSRPREYKFMSVHGDGVHEIPVGPVHAGIIEPGHFRFSCLGEVVANLEIRLGYQHRGIELRLAEVPWRHGRHIAESASSDCAVANALAHSIAIENLLNVEVPIRAQALRTVALEIERLANHLGDLGSLCSDAGFAVGAAAFARLRGRVLGMGQTLSGTRFMKGFVCPGGIALAVGEERCRRLVQDLQILKEDTQGACKLMFGDPCLHERMDGIGALPSGLAAEFGMVGPVARASGSSYDARLHFPHALYPGLPIEAPHAATGDVLARAVVRRKEVTVSCRVLEEVLDGMPDGPERTEIQGELPADAVGLGVVESWRGELIHWITTDDQGGICRYAVRDPSFHNWTGLSIAVRHNLVADFPLINKSFNLSYCGNDL